MYPRSLYTYTIQRAVRKKNKKTRNKNKNKRLDSRRTAICPSRVCTSALLRDRCPNGTGLGAFGGSTILHRGPLQYDIYVGKGVQGKEGREENVCTSYYMPCLLCCDQRYVAAFFRAYLSSFSCISRSSGPPPSSRRTRALMDIRDRKERPGLSPPVLNSGKTRFGRREKNPGPCLESWSTPCCCCSCCTEKKQQRRRRRETKRGGGGGAWHVRPEGGPGKEKCFSFSSRKKVDIFCCHVIFRSGVFAPWSIP